MATFDDVRRLALALPGAEAGKTYGYDAFKVDGKTFVWDRPLSKKDMAALGDRAPTGPVLAAAVEHEVAKRALLESEPDWAFTTAHFDGHASVLVRLDLITVPDLEELVCEAWLCKAPQRLVDEFRPAD